MVYGVTNTGANAQSSSAASLAATYVNNIQAGSLLFLWFGGRGGGLTVTDNQSQTWTKRLSWSIDNAGSDWGELWTAPVTAAGTKPQVTANKAGGANFMAITIWEVTGIDTSGTGIDTSAVQDFATTSISLATAGNASAASEFCLCCGFANGGSTLGTGASHTTIDGFVNPLDIRAEYLTAGSTNGAAYTGLMTQSGFEHTVAVVAVFKLAAGGPTTGELAAAAAGSEFPDFGSRARMRTIAYLRRHFARRERAYA